MDLKELGLSDYEEKAYDALVRLGKASASSVSRESSVSYGKIYEVLASLERKGLVSVIPEKTKMFIATSPENLLKIVEEKEKHLVSVKKEINNLKQIYEQQEKEVVHLVKGKRNFYQIFKGLPKAETFDYSIKYTSEFHHDFVRSAKKKLKQNISIKSLTCYDQETEKNIQKWLKVHSNIRKIENKGVALSITDNYVVLGLIKSNITMSITDKAFINMMKTLFEKAYDNSEAILEKY